MTEVTALHMGQLHPFEQVLVLLLAFGPFLILGVVVFLVRRRDLAEEAPSETSEPPGGSSSERP